MTQSREAKNKGAGVTSVSEAIGAWVFSRWMIPEEEIHD
jgi:hypothetical protein